MNKGLLAGLCGLLIASIAFADDWPQFRGPDRSGISKEKRLMKEWPKAGPKLDWVYKDAGIGFSSFSVAKGVVYTIGTDLKIIEVKEKVDDKEVLVKKAIINDEYVIAIDEKTGKEKWRQKIGPVFVLKGNQWGDGPRSTPTIDGNYLYALGGQGILVCVDLAKQMEVWRKDFVKDLDGEMMHVGGDHWGYSESPLVDGKHVICTPGGAKGTVAALDKTNGNVIWRSKGLTNHAPYSSMVVTEIHGVRQYIQNSYLNDNNKETGFISGIEAATGKVLWSEPICGQSYAIATTPIVKGNQVYMSCGYGGGCKLYEINKDWTTKDVFAKKWQKKFKNTHGGVIEIDGNLYGHSETKMWVCQDWKTGEVKWDERFKVECVSGAITWAEGMLYLLADDGTVALIPTDPGEFKLVSSFKMAERSKLPEIIPAHRAANVWAHPVVANGHLYVRDHEFILRYRLTK
jgi:outer membrane protein assembly factor BamB